MSNEIETDIIEAVEIETLIYNTASLETDIINDIEFQSLFI